MFGDISGDRKRVNVHQQKRAVPEPAYDQTLETLAAAHGVQWGAAAAEQPQLVSLVSFSRFEGFFFKW